MLGNTATKDELDAGEASNNRVFWSCVKEAFAKPFTKEDDEENCGVLHWPNDAHLSAGKLNLSITLKHSWSKLQAIQKELSERCETWNANFTELAGLYQLVTDEHFWKKISDISDEQIDRN